MEQIALQLSLECSVISVEQKRTRCSAIAERPRCRVR